MGIHIMPPLFKIVMPEVKTAIFYPDAHPESTTVDGFVAHETVGSWAEVQGGDGDYHIDTGTGLEVTIRASSQRNKWYMLRRSIILFDISSLGAIEVRKATISLYGNDKNDTLGISPTINIFESNPASNTDLVNADYTTLGDTPLAAAISYSAFSTTSYNDFTLNAASRALIQVASKGDGIVKLGVREASYDAPNNAPGWHDLTNPIATFEFWSADKGGDYRPKLTLEYV